MKFSGEETPKGNFELRPGLQGEMSWKSFQPFSSATAQSCWGQSVSWCLELLFVFIADGSLTMEINFCVLL